MDLHELRSWLRLLETPQLGRQSARKLLAAFGSPQAVFAASAVAWREVVGPKQVSAMGAPPENLEALLNATLVWLNGASERQSRHVITLGDLHYPGQLLAIADPPVLLYAQGRLELLQADALAVVGSRNPTPQGADNARHFSSHLSQCGFTVVSGMALGIDTEAHTGALGGMASTIAVVGTGLDRVYPRQNQALAHRIAEAGLILSEYPIGTAPLAPNFPLRNRIIAGLSRGTLVVEATLQSGSLITARLANESGREVFAIPGSIHSPQSRGCHVLIKQGAKLVETAQDILEELSPRALNAPTQPAELDPDDLIPARCPEGITDSGDQLLNALGFDPVMLDVLMTRTGWSTAEIQTRLLELELDGQVARLPGQLFQRVVRD
jgi:DNA processing protein